MEDRRKNPGPAKVPTVAYYRPQDVLGLILALVIGCGVIYKGEALWKYVSAAIGVG